MMDIYIKKEKIQFHMELLKRVVKFFPRENRIDILKTLANLSDDEFDIFPKFRVQMRLENIEKYLKVVKKTIDSEFLSKGN